jgi:hypothetical protein
MSQLLFCRIVGRDLYLDVSSVLMTSNNEAVALSACTMSMVGPILKSVAGQIQLGELITTYGKNVVQN